MTQVDGPMSVARRELDIARTKYGGRSAFAGAITGESAQRTERDEFVTCCIGIEIDHDRGAAPDCRCGSNDQDIRHLKVKVGRCTNDKMSVEHRDRDGRVSVFFGRGDLRAAGKLHADTSSGRSKSVACG